MFLPGHLPQMLRHYHYSQVLLLSMPGIKDFYTQCCNYAENEKAPGDAVHPTALFKVQMFHPVLFRALYSL